MRSSSEGINIAASAQKLDVDNRISLRFYCRISDNILKQAAIFRGEGNIIDLYVMLLRFSSLVSETIPCHREYRASPQSYKTSLKKKLLIALSELENLKPEVQKKIDEFNRKQTYQADGWVSTKRQSTIPYSVVKTTQPAAREYRYDDLRVHQFSLQKPVKEQFQRLSLSVPYPKEETLSRHSILGPSGLNGKWQQPSRSDKRIQYPGNIDFTPVEIPRENSLLQPPENEVTIEKAFSNSTHEQQSLGLDLPLTDDNKMQRPEEPSSLISFEPIEVPAQPEIIRQPSPPPVLADVQDLVPALPPVSVAEHGIEDTSTDCLISPESPLELHFSSTLMDSFMKLAKPNTDKNLETCGVLAGLLKNRKFYVTALIIPKQESTSDSCQTTNEEELFEVQDKQSLFALGWIHTHPTQSCFMSSIDLHTHYSYQMMLPESIAIVMAPQDSSRNHGIFRLTTPGGMAVIRQCPRRGFHAHEQPPDGGPLYKQCTDVYMNPSIKFDVIDLR